MKHQADLRHRLRRPARLTLALVLAGAAASFSEPPQPGRDYRISAQHSRKCLDVVGEVRNDGAPARQASCHGGDSQLFRSQPVEGDTVQIIAKHSGKCLDLRAGQLVQFSCDDGSKTQSFRLRSAGKRYHRIQSAASGMCLSVKDRSREDDAAVVEVPCDEAVEWELW